MTRLLFAALLLAMSAAAPARDVPKPPAQGMVSAADPRAAAAGVEILNAGGSATDAAIATMLALNVVEPQNSGIGGGSFWVMHEAGTAKTTTIDAREAAPMAADGRWFYGDDGQPMSHAAAVPGGRSVGVPGALRAMALAHRDHGVLPWARLFAPAIRLARDGFVVTPRLHNGLNSYGRHVDAWAKAHFFTASGDSVAVGSVLKSPEQAAFLQRIADRGADAFYVGPTAQAVVAAVNGAARNPSKMTTGDLANYEAKPRPPVCGTYRGYRICGMGPPSSGGVAVLTILKQLERFDMAKLGPTSPVAWHLFAESERLAYADRDMYLADPDYVKVPVAGLIDPAYIATRSALISPDTTMASVLPGTPAGAPVRRRAPVSEVPGTSDLAVTDAKGNVVEITTTIEGYFGSGVSVDGTMLNNELTDFRLRAGEGRVSRRQPGRGRQAAAQFDVADDRLQPRWQRPHRGGRGGRLHDHRAGGEGAGRGPGLAHERAGRDRARAALRPRPRRRGGEGDAARGDGARIAGAGRAGADRAAGTEGERDRARRRQMGRCGRSAQRGASPSDRTGR